MGRGAGLIDALVFSKDRPAQLDLLLRSIGLYALNLYERLTVLWTASAPEYEQGYLVCAGEHPGADFWKELLFELDVRRWLETAGPVISFLCDDDLFYRDATAPEALPWSFRGGDYDYPFSLDGNVYKRDWIVRLIEGFKFDDPTQLEWQGHELRDLLPFAEVHPCEPPCLVGVPENCVSASSRMPHQGQHEYDLNERYLAGGRLEFLRYHEERSPAAHASPNDGRLVVYG